MKNRPARGYGIKGNGTSGMKKAMANEHNAGVAVAAVVICGHDDCGIHAGDSGRIFRISEIPRLQTDQEQRKSQNQYRAHGIGAAFCRRAVL
ncbi:MAG TPA: hypothetical protein VLA28_06210 [Afifellaceae bacterium]|nr:hypothetical protein [Afifellaceae bacterium]